MEEQYITCPACGAKIQLSEAFTNEIETRLRMHFNTELKNKTDMYRKAMELKEQEFQESLARERAEVAREEREKAKEVVSVELKDLQRQVAEVTRQRDEAQGVELDLRKRQRELEERERSLTLEVERTIDGEKRRIREETLREVTEEHRLKEAEKDKQLSDMKKKIDELQQKAETASQQVQGEVMELELETILSRQFRHDSIEAVAKGVRGADVIQHVHDERGTICGKIIWESKRTKAWSDGWIQKLKDDQRASKSEIAVLISTILPKGVERFGIYDGVWVTDVGSAIGLATALRENLIQVAFARTALIGKNEKMELIYNYLTGSAFTQRVKAIVETFVTMKDDLEAEKRAMEKLWAKREAQIYRVIKNTSTLYGELEGIAGSSLPEIKMLQMPE